MALGVQHVSSFSPDGKLFALVNEQGVLKIWNTETNQLKQEFTPNLHLSAPCTSLLWISAATAPQKKSKKERSTEKAADTLYVVLGGSNGDVSLYSFTTGKIERTFNGEGHSGKITGIAHDGKNTLYTCGEDSFVIVWNINLEKRVAAWSIGNEVPHSLSYLDSLKFLVVGARQIKIYSTESQELIQTFTGHTSDVTLLTSFSNDQSSEYVLSASKMERIICLWKIGSKNKNRSAASCSFLMEDIANCLTCKIDADNLKVASVTRSGVIHFYIISLSSIKAEKPFKPKVTIEIASDSSTVIEPIPVISATLQFGFGKKEILYGYGDKTFMLFEEILPNFSEKLQVLVRADPKKILSKSSKTQQSDKVSKTLLPAVNQTEVVYKTTTTTVPKKRLNNSVETPMETRLQNLNLNNGEIPQAQSKVQLLIQALHSKDAILLRTVLSTQDPKVITLTLQKLPVQYVGSLVNELTFLMQKKRIHVETSLNWLKSLMHTHSSQLMALGADDLFNKFGPCIGIIEHRSNCLKDISKLNGRLQLLVSQIKTNTEEDNLNNENVLIYEDNDSSHSDIEDENGTKSISDDEWEEDSDEEMES